MKRSTGVVNTIGAIIVKSSREAAKRGASKGNFMGTVSRVVAVRSGGVTLLNTNNTTHTVTIRVTLTKIGRVAVLGEGESGNRTLTSLLGDRAITATEFML